MCVESESYTPLGVIGYEIDMLRFCLKFLGAQSTTSGTLERKLYVEGFLLHYRNLIRCFSGNGTQPDELSMSRPEAFGESFPVAKAEWYKTEAAALDNREPDCDYKRISKYLQHCTVTRLTLPDQWQLSEMYKRIKPMLVAFEHDCLNRPAIAVAFGEVSGSTVSVNRPMSQLSLTHWRKDS